MELVLLDVQMVESQLNCWSIRLWAVTGLDQPDGSRLNRCGGQKTSSKKE
jgi:hypothetical protein